MLDSTPIIHTMTAEWRDHISPGDIVSFRFPLAEDGNRAHPKARPCLILDIEERGDHRFALIAYGTTSRRKSNIGYEVHVRRREDYAAAGLNRPTRFVGARRVLVSLDHSGFALCGATGSAVLGRIEGKPYEVMNLVRGRIYAIRDIAADRRARAQRFRMRGRKDGTGRARPAVSLATAPGTAVSQ
ncbi:hypothetical protein [Jannaschia donghaensis]|uniref:PemK-like protein n=1 Tax=Jannaschia donghaensis TaxID=420998 RepID=A0A0M6YFP8_9RHOB|nr:hypothetical protein [Jannaschia donghaensis]CTQ48097.1 hypothetical protein JDO7802_00099 [Jannaschia donghaensis]